MFPVIFDWVDTLVLSDRYLRARSEKKLRRDETRFVQALYKLIDRL